MHPSTGHPEIEHPEIEPSQIGPSQIGPSETEHPEAERFEIGYAETERSQIEHSPTERSEIEPFAAGRVARGRSGGRGGLLLTRAPSPTRARGGRCGHALRVVQPPRPGSPAPHVMSPLSWRARTPAGTVRHRRAALGKPSRTRSAPA
ncbi:hypothetical protein [Streptomyces chrestomyceticus]|uniref:hypothetical protein n=1 Tax=Streptomyces chrestomyceticus TaxID=68185 RepID=UPI0033D4F967